MVWLVNYSNRFSDVKPPLFTPNAAGVLLSVLANGMSTVLGFSKNQLLALLITSHL